jgi:NAD(P)-dependent dehydrogenase (short-subunit alcohol dehydrogenase family)
MDRIVNNAGVAPEIFGIAAQPGGLRAHETSMKTFDTTMRINTRGVFLGCKYALAQFLAQEPLPRNSRGDAARGWIVNVASLAGLVAFAGAPSYTMSKHAVIGLTKEIGVDYARDRIHCNALCPSCKSLPFFTKIHLMSANAKSIKVIMTDQRAVIDTPLIAALLRDAENPVAVGTTQALTAAHPWGNLGQPEDVARAAVFLVSEDSQWITAQPLVIDGGYMAQ